MNDIFGIFAWLVYANGLAMVIGAAVRALIMGDIERGMAWLGPALIGWGLHGMIIWSRRQSRAQGGG